MKEKVTVIVPVYNGEKTIQKCIDSILMQSYTDFKIIIINDGSTDKTNEVLNNLYANNKNIEILQQQNQGVSAARNLGLNKVKTEYVSFVDADDFVDRDFILSLLKGFSKGDIDLSINGIKRYDPIKKINYDYSCYKTGIFSNQHTLNYIFSASGPKGYLANKMWKTSIIQRYHIELDSTIKMAEDLLFTVTYLLVARDVWIDNYCGYNYVHRKNSLSSGVDLKNIDSKFKDTNINYIRAYLKIIDLLSKSTGTLQSKASAEANLGLIYTTFLRQLNLMGKKDHKFNKKIYAKSKRYFLSVMKNKDISLKRKLVYLITIINPQLMTLLDRNKN